MLFQGFLITWKWTVFFSVKIFENNPVLAFHFKIHGFLGPCEVAKAFNYKLLHQQGEHWIIPSDSGSHYRFVIRF